MAKIMEIVAKETKGKSYHTYKYSYDSVGLPSIDYDDDPNKIMKWKDSAETGSPKRSIDLKPLADQLQKIGEPPLLKYFLDGSRHVFKVDDIAYNKQVFPVVAGQIGIGCCRRENKRMHKERFYRELVLALPDKANADGWDDTAYFASKVTKINESEELKRLGLRFSAILPYSTAKAGTIDAKLDTLAVAAVQDYMVEAEKRMVAELVKDKRLGQDAYLLKDGSLEYKVMKTGSSIHSIRGVLRPAFQLAVDDDLIRKNPFGFELASVIVNDSVTREAITRKQERELLRFIKEDKHFCRYYDAIYILFHTGLRISEFCGLTISDIEFDHKRIKVDHQLQRTSQMQYVIQSSKTESGIRYVPMSDEVVACFRRILSKRVTPKVEPLVDGYAGFLFLDKNDRPMVALHWEKYMQHIVEKYNKIYRIQMPKVTPHVCRHTFCSNMAKSGMNPKTLQYIMGHSDISVTLNVYTHVQFDDAQAELLRVAEA